MNERRVEVTSSAWLFGPKEAFSIIGPLNKKRPPEAQIGLELYPTHYLKGMSFGPGRITLDRILAWRKEFGDVPIERIHLPFHWDLPSGFYNYFYHSFFKEPLGVKDRLIATPLAGMLGTVQNGFGQKLASELDAGVNAHVYLVEEAEKRDRLDLIKVGAKYVWVENDPNYPRKRLDQYKKWLDPARTLDAVERNGLDGVILGIDHYYRRKLDPRDDIAENRESLKKHLKCVHISGEDGEHGLIDPKDGNFWALIDFLKANFDESVSFCLDLNPFEMGRMTQDAQVDYIKAVVQRLEK